ncbi:hypothetical protein F4819DRAFT_446213 [Hypoxylon fuscum]|nr:hypothetical protein F4819DRAFT_446213 [Hypoxylon fuscum]
MYLLVFTRCRAQALSLALSPLIPTVPSRSHAYFTVLRTGAGTLAQVGKEQPVLGISDRGLIGIVTSGTIRFYTSDTLPSL